MSSFSGSFGGGSPSFTVARLSADLGVHDSGLEDAINRLEGKIGGLVGTLNGLASAAAGFLVGTVIARGLKTAADAAIDLESRLAQLRKTTGLSGGALDELKDKLAGLSSTMAGVKLGDLFDVASMGGRLGIAGDKIAGFARDIGMIKVALEDIPAEEAATSIARILNVFHLGTEDAIRFASALNKLDDSSTATGRDILDITQRLSGPAAALGLAPTKVLALAAALKDAGVENEVAGTAIGQMFAKMATNVADFARVARVSAKDFTEAFKADPLNALVLVSDGLKKLEPMARFEALKSLGLEGARTVTTLLQLGEVSSKLGGYVRDAEGEWGTMASILRENALQGNTTRAVLEQMNNILTVTAAKVGDSLLPVIKALARSVGELATDFQGIVGRNSGVIGAISAKLAEMGRGVGLLVAEWRTFAALGQSFATEKFEQLGAILTRLGEQIGPNVSVAFSNIVKGVANSLEAISAYLGDTFEALGTNAALRMAKGVNAALPDLAKTLLDKAGFGPHLAVLDILARSPAVPMPDAGARFNVAALGAGMQPLPGMDLGAVVADLPNRQAERAPLLGRLADVRGQRERAAALARLRDRPDVQAAIDAANKGAAGLKGERALDRLNRENARARRPAFRGTEGQAAAILAERERKKKVAEARRDARNARRPLGAAGRAGIAAADTAESVAARFGLAPGVGRGLGAVAALATGGLPGAIRAFGPRPARRPKAKAPARRGAVPNVAGPLLGVNAAQRGQGGVMGMILDNQGDITNALGQTMDQIGRLRQQARQVRGNLGQINRGLGDLRQPQQDAGGH